MKSIENAIESTIMAARWLLVVFYVGLGAALVIYAIAFVYKFVTIAAGVFEYEEGEMILAMLGLIDAALVASLLVMVMISSYENYVSRLESAGIELAQPREFVRGVLEPAHIVLVTRDHHHHE